MIRIPAFLYSALFVIALAIPAFAEDSAKWVTYPGGEGPGAGKHIVIVTGDDEYRSEESMPQLGKILAVRHGYTVTVLFAINKETGAIDPATQDNIPGLEALDSAEADSLKVFLHSRGSHMLDHDRVVLWFVSYDADV